MCQSVTRSSNNFSKELYETKSSEKNTSTNTCEPPKPEELVCKPESPKDNINIPLNLTKTEKSIVPKQIIFPVVVDTTQNIEDEIQDYSKTISKTAIIAQKVPKVISTIAEAESDATGIMMLASKANPVAQAITESRVFQVTSKVVGNPVVAKGAGAFGIITGGLEINKGINEINKGNSNDGTYHVIDGGSNVVGGVALMAGSAPVAAGAAAFGIGLGVGRYGDNSTKELGWLKDKNGKAESISDRLGDRMWDIDQSVQNATGNETIGHIVGVGSGLVMLPAAGVVAVGGAVVSGGEKVCHGVASAWNYVFN